MLPVVTRPAPDKWPPVAARRRKAPITTRDGRKGGAGGGVPEGRSFLTGDGRRLVVVQLLQVRACGLTAVISVSTECVIFCVTCVCVCVCVYVCVCDTVEDAQFRRHCMHDCQHTHTHTHTRFTAVTCAQNA